MASPLAEGWIYATVPIDNQWGGSGSGFLVYRSTAQHEGRAFLVTNKPVIHRDPAVRSTATHVICHFNTQEPDNRTGTLAGSVSLRDTRESEAVSRTSRPGKNITRVIMACAADGSRARCYSGVFRPK